MKKLFYSAMFLLLLMVFPMTVMAQVSVHVNIPLPPPIVFPGPPQVVIVPETDVYVVPDVDDEIYFVGGWWWRPWQGRWYRSRYHDRGWRVNSYPPPFYKTVPPGWRNDYRDRHWKGHSWHYERIPHDRLNKNWRSWHNNRYWERNKSWNVQGLPPKKHYQKSGPKPGPAQSSRKPKGPGKYDRRGR